MVQQDLAAPEGLVPPFRQIRDFDHTLQVSGTGERAKESDGAAPDPPEASDHFVKLRLASLSNRSSIRRGFGGSPDVFEPVPEPPRGIRTFASRPSTIFGPRRDV